MDYVNIKSEAAISNGIPYIYIKATGKHVTALFKAIDATIPGNIQLNYFPQKSNTINLQR